MLRDIDGPARARAVAFWSLLFTSAIAGSARGDQSASSRREANPAPRLVQQALDAELAGDMARRAKLLADALEADPEFAPARWQSGQLNFDGEWRSPEEVENLVNNHPRWVGYRQLRDSLGASPADHLELAEYCREHDLANEGRYHWAVVLLARPDYRPARDHLAVQEYQGRLFTKDQVASLKRQDKDTTENFELHRPRMTKLCREATGSDAARRTAALAEIRALADPALMAALDLAAEKSCEKSPRFAGELHLAVVAALANMPQHEATLRLMNHATFADAPEVRQGAAEALKLRPQTDYVPLLMAAMRTPLEVEVDVLSTPDGSVHLTETVAQSGPESDVSHVRRTNYWTEGAMRHDPAKSNPADVLQGNLADAESLALDTQDRVDAANADAEFLNQRIVEALRIAVGAELDENPETWWAEWQAYNELRSAAEDPVVSTYQESNFVYYYPQAPVLYGRRTEGEGSLSRRLEPTNPREMARNPNGSPVLPTIARERNGGVVMCECFVAGTLVATQTGPKPIETIVAGDFVFAQNPATGEIAYRPVLRTTMTPQARVVAMRIGDETIVATGGHRFWVNGRGWQMAKFLKPQARLHGLRQPVAVEAVLTHEATDCFNLEVDEFHTYFVGKSMVLVHDRNCPRPVLASVPGSETMRLSGDSDSPAN